MAMPNVTTRPTFPLVPAVSELDYSFLQFGDNFSVTVDSHDSNTFSGPYTWVLDFTHGEVAWYSSESVKDERD